MKRRCLHLFVLLLFSTGIVSTSVGEALRESTGVDEVHHAEGSTCPDPDSDEHPCGPSCPCTCCPGHLTAAAITPLQPVIVAPLSDEIEISMRDDLHPKDVLSRIFHPPRV